MSKDRLQPVDQEYARILLQEHISRAADMLGLPKDELSQFSDYARLIQETLTAIRFDPSLHVSFWDGYKGQQPRIVQQAGIATLDELNHPGGQASSLVLWRTGGTTQDGSYSGVSDKPHYTPVMVGDVCITNVAPIVLELARFTGAREERLPIMQGVILGEIGVNEDVMKLGLTPYDRLEIRTRPVSLEGRIILAPTYHPVSS